MYTQVDKSGNNNSPAQFGNVSGDFESGISKVGTLNPESFVA